MKLALVGPTYPFRGGIAQYTTLLCHHLRQGHEVEFYSFRRQYPRWLFPGRTDLDPGRPAVAVEAKRIIDPLQPWTWVQVARRVRATAPDLLVMQWWVPFWAPTLWTIARLSRTSGTRVLFVCHNVLPHEKRAIDRPLARWVLGQGDAFIVQSERDERDLLSLLPGVPVRRAFHPTYEELAYPGPPPADARQQLGLPADAAVLLFFGFVRAYKGLATLIEALPEIARHVDVRLLVVGEFWDDRAPYERQMEALGVRERVQVVDRYVPAEELGVYFGAADVAVLPYADATQSGALQLAFGYGLPVVTTRVGGLAEVVDDGETGFLVPPGDPPALAAAVARYFGQGLGPIFRANVQARKDRFSWDHLVATIEELARP